MRWKAISCVVALVISTLCAFAAPPLLEVATKVCDASKWTGSPVYLWLSERKVLSWQGDSKKKIWSQRHLFKAVVVYLDTGKEKSLTAFNKRLDQLRGYPTYPLLSPDGKWILGFASSSGVSWFAITL